LGKEAKKKTDINKAAVPAETAAKVGTKTAAKKASKPNKRQKAQKAALAAKKGNNITKPHKMRTSVHFYRPKTLRLPRTPKYARRSVAPTPKLDQFQIIKYPHTAEGSMKKIEDHNTLVFIVDVRANKPQIKEAVKTLYDITAVKVNTLVRPDGQKKAFIRLAADHDALDVANKIGLI